MNVKLTDPQKRCLAWYEENKATNAIIPYRVGWNMRQVERLLDLDLLHVGPGGWHVPTDAGRALLAPPAPADRSEGGRNV